MSVQVGSEIKKTGSAIVTKAKEVAKPATTEGVATNFVGYVLSIPMSFVYDFVYDLLAKKVITNRDARDILKVILPAGIGAVFQFGKLPAGNIVAGTGYGIALLSLFKIIKQRITGGVKGNFFAKLRGKGTATTDAVNPVLQPTALWGLEGT